MPSWYFERSVATEVAPHALESSGDELIGNLLRGDESAIRDTYRRHHEAVRAFAQRLVGDESDAEELVQEVFVGLPKSIQSYRAEASLRSFLIGVAINHARHFVRAAARRRAAHERLGSEPPRSVQQPDEALAREQLANAITRALDHLPLQQRVAFVLCEVEERSSAEAAQIVGATDSTMRDRLRSAKQKLRRLLHDAGIS